MLYIPKGNLDMQHQTKIWMLPLGESTTESKSVRAGKSEGRFKEG